MLKKNIRFALIVLFSGYLLYAQDIEDAENKSITEQIWLDYNPSIKIKERLHLYRDIRPGELENKRQV